MTIRVRFAPSPTGYLHIGSARTALFNWLYARHEGGLFLLRIEDTDVQRSTEASTRSIIEGLEWLGLDYDEEIVFQSDNFEKHRRAALRLVEEGTAYRDFTPKEVARRRQRQAGHRRACARGGRRRHRSSKQSLPRSSAGRVRQTRCCGRAFRRPLESSARGAHAI